MADMLKRAAEWLEQKRTAHCSSPVTYRRAGQADAQVNATFGRTQYEVSDESGFTVAGQTWDFLIRAADFPVALGEPKPGDAIIADGRRHEVLALGDEFRGWRWSDPHRQTYRIHTQDMGTPA